MLSLILGFTLLVAASGDHAPAGYGAPAPVYGHPAPAYKEEKAEPYSYTYGVSDEYSGTEFSANENSDANVVSGSYSVNLPDGRVQTVTYTADHYNGYVADVKVRNIFTLLNMIKTNNKIKVL